MIRRYSIYKKSILEDSRSEKLVFESEHLGIYYVYRVTDLEDSIEKYYYGSRISQDLDVMTDFWDYCTSSNKQKLIKELKTKRFAVKIIKVFDNYGDMIIYESFMHQRFNVKDHLSFWNGYNHHPLFFVKEHSQKTKDKISESHKKKWEDEEYREYMKLDENARQKISITSKELWKTDEYRSKVMSERQKTYDTEEYKQSKSISAKKVYEDEEYKKEWYKKCKEKVWDNPEWKEKQSIASKISQNRPEVKEKHRENTKKLWQDPEWRRKTLENRPSKKTPYVIINKSYDIIREYKSRDELAESEKISLHLIRNIVKEDKFINIDELSKSKKVKLKDLDNLKIITKEQYETNKNI